MRLGQVEVKHKDELNALDSLFGRACGIDATLMAYDKTIESNFKNSLSQPDAGQHKRITSEQMDWLHMIKDHVVSSYHIAIEDLDYTPFDSKGGRGRMWELFGEGMMPLIDELNFILAV